MKNSVHSFTKLFVLGLMLLGATKVFAFGDVDIFPDWINFSDTKVGSSQRHTVNVRNVSGRNIPSMSIQQWGDSSEFHVTNWCFSLLANGSCSLDVEFRPTAAGNYNMDIEFWGSVSSDRIRVNGRAYDR